MRRACSQSGPGSPFVPHLPIAATRHGTSSPQQTAPIGHGAQVIVVEERGRQTVASDLYGPIFAALSSLSHLRWLAVKLSKAATASGVAALPWLDAFSRLIAPRLTHLEADVRINLEEVLRSAATQAAVLRPACVITPHAPAATS